jgi:hypothetical protein
MIQRLLPKALPGHAQQHMSCFGRFGLDMILSTLWFFEPINSENKNINRLYD